MPTDASSKWASRLAAVEELTSKWKGVGIDSLQKTVIPDERLQLAANREMMQLGRKNVSRVTKEFAGIAADEEKLAAFPALLKQYQSYIDELTKFVKHAERICGSCHDAMLGMTNPAPILERLCREKDNLLGFIAAADSASESRRLLAERESELAGLKDQDHTINSLREQLAAAEMATAAQKEENASSATQEVSELLRQWQQREREVHAERAAAAQEASRHQQAAVEATAQVNDLRDALESADTRAQETIESLMGEVDTLTGQVKLLQRRNSELMGSQKNDGSASSPMWRESLDFPAPADGAGDAVAEHNAKEAALLRRRVAELEEQVEALEVDRERQTVGHREVQKQLDAATAKLRHVEPAAAEANSLRQQLPKAEARAVAAEQSLEAAQSEATALRVQVKQITTEHTRVAAALRDAEAELRQAFNNTVPGSRSNSALTGSTTEPSAALGEPNDIGGGAADGTLAAVVAQRDRYRERLFAMEESTGRQVDRANAKVDQLTRENEQLRRSAVLEGTAAIGVVDFETAAAAETEHRAAQLDQQIGQRAGGSLAEMGVQAWVVQGLDRTAVLLSRVVLANQASRRIFLGYLVTVHALVALVLMERFLMDI